MFDRKWPDGKKKSLLRQHTSDVIDHRSMTPVTNIKNNSENDRQEFWNISNTVNNNWPRLDQTRTNRPRLAQTWCHHHHRSDSETLSRCWASSVSESWCLITYWSKQQVNDLSIIYILQEFVHKFLIVRVEEDHLNAPWISWQSQVSSGQTRFVSKLRWNRFTDTLLWSPPAAGMCFNWSTSSPSKTPLLMLCLYWICWDQNKNWSGLFLRNSWLQIHWQESHSELTSH